MVKSKIIQNVIATSKPDIKKTRKKSLFQRWVYQLQLNHGYI